MDYPSSYGHFIYQGKASTIFKVDEPEGVPKKIRKILNSDSPESCEEKCFENEFKLTHDLHIPGVRKAISLHNQDGALVLELEYFDGITIKEKIISDPLDLGVFLKIAIEITNALESLHQLHIVHKNLSSENILVNNQHEIQLIDFGLAGKTHQLSNDVGNLEQLERSLAYISPEQTGRLHREVDERSDLYSLGVIFYEMLTGKLPFEGKDNLELVYANFIQIPIAPHVIRNVPQVLSEIILKLLEKNPDDRYQSGFGLKHDLQECLIQLEKGGEIKAFPLARNDFSRKFKLPQELYGREKEKAQLLQLFENACSGPAQIVFISGYSGVGKTALVQELSKYLPERRGCFISGKFDQYQRDTPYYAWIQAFEAFVNQALTESIDRMEYWKEKIVNAVWPNGKLLTDVIGHLETLIGKQPEINKINPVDSQFRFNQTVINFIKALSTKEHPFFIFVDDWQWADLPSLDLLKVLATDPEIQFVMIVGTFRENEVDTTHPLVRRMHEIKMQNRVTHEIKLQDISPTDVAQLIADTLNTSVKSCQSFAKLIYTKTQGNAFFLRQILYTIYQANLLQFNPAKQSWDWELEKIRQLNITDNVVGLMAEKVLRLPIASQHVLKLSSCIGTLFNLTTLSVIYEKPAAETSKDLLNPLQEGLIIQIKDNYKFAHDRIQQAVYSLIPEQDRKLFHLQIGRLLLQNAKHQGENESQLDGQLFDIASHLNVGRNLIKSKNERIQLAQLNLKAGLKAKPATAFPSAANFFNTGITLLPKDAWQIHYDLTFQLYEECAECEFIIAQETESEKHYSILLKNTQTALKKADILSTQVWQYIGVYRMEEAYKKATMGLHLCGIDIPRTEKELKQQSIRLEAEIEYLVQHKTLHKFIDASLVTDPVQIVRMKNFYTMACQGYITADFNRFKFCALKGIALSLRSGLFDLSPNMFAMYSRILAGKDLYQEAYEFARLAIGLADSNTKARGRTQAYTRAAFWGCPYGEPLKTSVPIFIKGAEVGWEMGDLVQSGPSHLDIAIHMFHQGNSLKDVEKYADKAVEYNKKVNFRLVMDASLIEKRLASYLQNRDPAYDLSDASFPIQQISRIKSNMINGFLWFNRIQVKFWFEAYKEAYEIAKDKFQLF
ncbi:MAG TPA: serine/threonine-protein kinase PknK, partial [Lunatimonas sp.]|nr:serine/threonine-protein kinase PknK [Lunatimonas sp.]